MKENLKIYKKNPEKFFITSISLRPKNHAFIKKHRINLTKLVNDFLSENNLKDLKLEFNEVLENSTDRVISSLRLKNENKVKVNSVNLSFLVNHLIESFKNN